MAKLGVVRVDTQPGTIGPSEMVDLIASHDIPEVVTDYANDLDKSNFKLSVEDLYPLLLHLIKRRDHDLLGVLAGTYANLKDENDKLCATLMKAAIENRMYDTVRWLSGVNPAAAGELAEAIVDTKDVLLLECFADNSDEELWKFIDDDWVDVISRGDWEQHKKYEELLLLSPTGNT